MSQQHGHEPIRCNVIRNAYRRLLVDDEYPTHVKRDAGDGTGDGTVLYNSFAEGWRKTFEPVDERDVPEGHRLDDMPEPRQAAPATRTDVPVVDELGSIDVLRSEWVRRAADGVLDPSERKGWGPSGYPSRAALEQIRESIHAKYQDPAEWLTIDFVKVNVPDLQRA